MFETMITSVLMTLLYYAGTSVICVGTGVLVVTGYQGYDRWLMAGAGILALLVYRLICEAVVIRFRIYEVLVQIRDDQRVIKQIFDNGSEAGEQVIAAPQEANAKIREWSKENNLEPFKSE